MSARVFDLASLYLAEKGRLQRLVLRIVGDRSVAEDLAQDTFVKLTGRPLDTQDRGLLVRTARNLAIDHLRAQRVRRTYLDGAPRDDSCREALPDEAIAAREELEELLAALETLPERTQRIFLLNRLDGLSQPAIARTLGVSLSTVEKEIIRALAFCRSWQKQRSRN